MLSNMEDTNISYVTKILDDFSFQDEQENTKIIKTVFL